MHSPVIKVTGKPLIEMSATALLRTKKKEMNHKLSGFLLKNVTPFVSVSGGEYNSSFVKRSYIWCVIVVVC